MKALIDLNGGIWNKAISNTHKEAMFELLKEECGL